MNDFKTSGCKPSYTGDPSPILGLGLSESFAVSPHLVIDCNGVTFSLKELDIDIVLDKGKLRKYLENANALVINGMKFVKAGSEKRREG